MKSSLPLRLRCWSCDRAGSAGKWTNGFLNILTYIAFHAEQRPLPLDNLGIPALSNALYLLTRDKLRAMAVIDEPTEATDFASLEELGRLKGGPDLHGYEASRMEHAQAFYAFPVCRSGWGAREMPYCLLPSSGVG